ncbi:ABC transporter permease [uncultured Sulfitobacter sp.]|uniref:ABC transporter permease n=1 Tax=uncultured Sulfitobacter sp. TaxID=191468 RepID=UPI0026101B39|nr:ABC transporter permease [uncultured Sulfitobacter sp.]
MSDQTAPPSDNTPAPLPEGSARPRRSFATLRSITALMLREMATTYGRSPGGYIWAVIEPAAGIALLSLVFSAALRNPPVGISFAMFYATGMLPFMMFSDIHGKIATSLLFSKQLLAYPTVTFVDAILARFFLNIITLLLVGYIIFTGCLLMFETRTTLNLPIIVQAYALSACLGIGVGTLNAYTFTRFNVVQRFWSILMRPLVLVSGVIIPLYSFPQPYRDYLWYNPLMHVTGMMRAGFYPEYESHYVTPSYVMGIALACMAMGLLLLRRHHQDILTR